MKDHWWSLIVHDGGYHFFCEDLVTFMYKYVQLDLITKNRYPVGNNLICTVLCADIIRFISILESWTLCGGTCAVCENFWMWRTSKHFADEDLKSPPCTMWQRIHSFFLGCLDLGYPKIPLWDPRARCVQHLQRIFQRSLGSLDILDFVIGWTSAMWSCMELLILRLWKLMVSSVPGVKLAWIVSCLPNSESLRGLNKKCRQASPLGCCWLVLLPCSWTFDIQCDASQLSSCSCHSLWGCHLQRSDYNKHWVDEDHSGAPKIAKLVYD